MKPIRCLHLSRRYRQPPRGSRSEPWCSFGSPIAGRCTSGSFAGTAGGWNYPRSETIVPMANCKPYLLLFPNLSKPYTPKRPMPQELLVSQVLPLLMPYCRLCKANWCIVYQQAKIDKYTQASATLVCGYYCKRISPRRSSIQGTIVS